MLALLGDSIMQNPTILAVLVTFFVTSVCGDLLCPKPKVPSYGYIAKGYQNTYEVGSVVVYACKYGYQLWGQSTVKCLKSGKIEYWSSGPPECKKCKHEELELVRVF